MLFVDQAWGREIETVRDAEREKERGGERAKIRKRERNNQRHRHIYMHTRTNTQAHTVKFKNSIIENIGKRLKPIVHYSSTA